MTCENCHGAGKAHVEGGGDVTKIFDPAKASPKEVDATCLGCHAGAHPNFDAFASCQGRRQLHQLPQRPCQRRQAGEPAQGSAAHALLPVPHRREAGSSICRSTTR